MIFNCTKTYIILQLFQMCVYPHSFPKQKTVSDQLIAQILTPNYLFLHVHSSFSNQAWDPRVLENWKQQCWFITVSFTRMSEYTGMMSWKLPCRMQSTSQGRNYLICKRDILLFCFYLICFDCSCLSVTLCFCVCQLPVLLAQVGKKLFRLCANIACKESLGEVLFQPNGSSL